MGDNSHLTFFEDEIQFSFGAASLFMDLEYTVQLKCNDETTIWMPHPAPVFHSALSQPSWRPVLAWHLIAGLLKHCNYNIIFPFTGVTRPRLPCQCNPDPRPAPAAFYLSILMARPLSRMTVQFRPPPPTLDLEPASHNPCLPPTASWASKQPLGLGKYLWSIQTIVNCHF